MPLKGSVLSILQTINDYWDIYNSKNQQDLFPPVCFYIIFLRSSSSWQKGELKDCLLLVKIEHYKVVLKIFSVNPFDLLLITNQRDYFFLTFFLLLLKNRYSSSLLHPYQNKKHKNTPFLQPKTQKIVRPNNCHKTLKYKNEVLRNSANSRAQPEFALLFMLGGTDFNYMIS